MTDVGHAPGTSFARSTERLSAASVQRRWEAYRAIDWSDPAYTLDPEDPCWHLPSWDPIGASDWYRDQSAARRSAVGLRRTAVLLKAGIEFEAWLNQGLLRYAATLPNGHPAFRYIHHEVTEEAQHSMMFQEAINRSGVDVPRSPPDVRKVGESFARTVDESPEQFFLMALSGEEVFDHIQRRMLASSTMHPLLRRIYEIHVAEEARHLSFARNLLREHVPRLSHRDARLLRLRAPFLVEWSATHIFGPASFLAGFDEGASLPEDVRSSIEDGPVATELRRRSCGRAVDVCRSLGLVDDRLDGVWSRLRGD